MLQCKNIFLSFVLLWTVSGKAESLAIGAKNFTENTVLAEMLALILEEKHKITVERKFNMGGTQLVFSALKKGDIDIYPEYTGTGYIMILNLSGEKDSKKTYQIVKEEFLNQWSLYWSLPLGFENSYTLAVKANDPRFKKDDVISSLQGRAHHYNLAIAHEFAERKDGFKYFVRKYNLKFPPDRVFTMNEGLMYTALENNRVDIIMAYSTNGKIKALNLKTLKDDKKFFPVYSAAYLARTQSIEKFPQILQAFKELEGHISEQEMIALNNKVDVLKWTPKQVARDFLIQKRVLSGSRVQPKQHLSLISYYFSKRHYFLKILMEHLALTFFALFFALLVSIPIGVWAARRRVVEKFVFTVVNVLQTIPSLALLGLLIPFMGIGFAPAVVALFVYSLLPLVRNICEGVKNVDRKFIEVSAGLGLTRWQILRFVQAPLAWPFVLAGARTSAVWAVGTAVLAAFVGAGGLGDPIFKGIATLDSRLIFLGAVPACLLALAVDMCLSILEKFTVSKGLKLETSTKQIAFK